MRYTKSIQQDASGCNGFVIDLRFKNKSGLDRWLAICQHQKMRSLVNKSRYAKLLSSVLPEAIETSEAHLKACDLVEELITKDVLSPEESKLTKLLTALIVAYEKNKFPHLGNASPLDVLEHIMENKGHTAKDLWGVIGDKGTVSKVLNGHRSISKLQAKQLAKFYDVSPALFI